MNAVPSFVFHDMDASHIDDKMDLASSPFPQPDDVDVELDSIRDPSVIEDEMIDYQADPADDADELHPDDEMIDQTSAAEHDIDYNMDASLEQTRNEEDDDILYEDDEDLDQVQPQVNDATEQAYANEELGPVPEDGHNDVILEELDDQAEPQDADAPDTNNSNHDTSDNHASTISDAPVAPISTDSRISEENVHEDAPSASPHPKVAAEDAEHQEQPRPEEDSGNVDSEHDTTQQEPRETATSQKEFSAPQDPSHESSDVHADDVALSTGPQDDSARHLHSVTLVYLDEEMSLFPPMLGDESSVYFLSDSSLAFEPLDRLLAACREILAGTLDHHDELVLDIPGLGLHICEDSKYAAQLTLSQVLEVYLNLCHNDDTREAQPLYCHLSSRISLASQYSYLSSAGAEGKTYAEIVADHVDTPEEVTQVEAPIPLDDRPDESNEAYEPDADHKVEGDPTEPASAAYGNSDYQTDNTARNILQPIEDPEKEIDDHGVVDEAAADEAAPMGFAAIDSEETVEVPSHEVEPITLAHDTTTEDQDQPPLEQVHEDESNSSHTVEAYTDDINDQEQYAEEVVGELVNEDLFDQFDEKADNPLDQRENVPLFIDDYEPYSDEELFAEAGDDDQSANGQTSTTVQVEPHLQSSNSNMQSPEDALALPSSELSDKKDGSHVQHDSETQGSAVKSPPITPSKGKLSKRKVEDDDELDFLNVDTPEPKRRRPS